MEEKYLKEIERLSDLSLAGMTSYLYHIGLSGIKYFELRKIIKKERQRLISKNL